MFELLTLWSVAVVNSARQTIAVYDPDPGLPSRHSLPLDRECSVHFTRGHVPAIVFGETPLIGRESIQRAFDARLGFAPGWRRIRKLSPRTTRLQVRESSRESRLPSGLKYADIRRSRSAEPKNKAIGLSVRSLRQQFGVCLVSISIEHYADYSVIGGIPRLAVTNW